MDIKTLFYFILSIFAGFYCKIYDDMNDNELFGENKFLLKYKSYINEFLKGIHYLLYAFISYEYYYFSTMVAITSVFQIVLYPDSFLEYETSGLLSAIFFIILLSFKKYKSFKSLFSDISCIFTLKFVCTLLFLYGNQFIFDLYLIGNIEYSFKKLLVRAWWSFSIFTLVVINHYKHYFSDDIICTILYFMGYFMMSCMFQIYLLTIRNNTKQSSETKIDTDPDTNIETEEDIKPEIEIKIDAEPDTNIETNTNSEGDIKPEIEPEINIK